MADTSRNGGSRAADRFWLGPVAGLVALILLGSAYFLLNRPKAPSKPASVLVPLTVSQIAALTFTVQGQTLTLYQSSGAAGTAWHIGSPNGAAADSSLAGNFVGGLVTLTPDRTLTGTPTSAQLKSFGLAPPTASVALKGSSGQMLEQVNVGVTSPVGSYYVQIAGKPTVYLVSGLVPSEISANPTAWLPAPSGTSGTPVAPASTGGNGAPPTTAASSSAAATTASAASSSTSG